VHVLRWYAPRAGPYQVNATFYEGQGGAVEAAVIVRMVSGLVIGVQFYPDLDSTGS
jgi:hypothetical protein